MSKTMTGETVDVTIHVKQRHIDLGVPGNCTVCMVALAAQEVLPHVSYVRINPISLVLSMFGPPDGKADHVFLPGIVREQIDLFDRGLRRLVVPFSFTLAIPAKYAPKSA